MSDTTEMVMMLGTVISMLSTISKTVSRYDRIMKRLERAQLSTEDATKEEHEMLEAVRNWQEDCARKDYESDMTESEKPKKRRVKKERDPERPKRAKSAFFLWCDDNRATVRDQLVSEGRTKITAATVAERLGEIWKEMDDEEKVSYQEESETLQARYREAIDAYNTERGITPRKTGAKGISPDTEAHVELPEGWTGPFEGYLAMHPVDPATGKRVMQSFETFEEAFAEAKRLGSACGGITLSTNTKGTRRLTLREATSVTFNPECNAIRKEISFIAPH
jgi:hypothetical protein